MSGAAPVSRTAASGAAARPSRATLATIGIVAGLTLVVVLLEVSVMPYLRIADGIPDLVAPLVVVVAVLRGTLLGAATGFGAGLGVELTAPIGTLGALALLYLAVGAFAGRYCEQRESTTLLAPLALAVAAAGFVQVGYALLHVMLGVALPAADLVTRVLVPTLALTALLSPPVVLAARRLLGSPRTIEPYAPR